MFTLTPREREAVSPSLLVSGWAVAGSPPFGSRSPGCRRGGSDPGARAATVKATAAGGAVPHRLDGADSQALNVPVGANGA